MARAVDEQPCEQTKKNEGQRNSGEVEAIEPNEQNLPPNEQRMEDTSRTALLNEMNTVNSNTNASGDCTSLNSIPVVSIKAGYIEDDAYGPPSSKQKMLELSMEDKVEMSEKENDAELVAPQPTWRLCMTISVLLLANVLNYMDRYTIAGEFCCQTWFENLKNLAHGD